VSKKSDQIAKLLGQKDLLEGLPDTGIEGSLLELGMYAVLLREVPPSRAVSIVQAMRKGYDDLNEARVAQAQELAETIAPRGKGIAHLAKHVPAARLVKLYLQEVFQKTHGLDLDFLIEDPVGGARVVSQMPLLGTAAGGYLLYLAEKGEMPVSAGIVRVLDRLGVMTRTSSVRKVRDSLEGLVRAEDRLPLAFILGRIVDRWCETRRPTCWECPMLDQCPAGKKVHREWKVQQERMEKQRKKDEARRLAQEKRDAQRRAREEERERKRLETEERQLQRQLEKERRDAERMEARKQREAERTKEVEARKKEAERKREAERKQAEARKKAEAKQRAAAKKKAEARKKAATKKKPVTKRSTATRKKTATTRKATKKSTGNRMTATKSSASTDKKGGRAARKTTRKKASGRG